MSPTTLIPFILAGSAVGQTVVQGPVAFAGNQHRYRLIQASSWEQARQWARDHGGDLATVRTPEENQFLFSQFGSSGRKYLIGLADADHPGSLQWSDGSSSSWRAWAPGEPAVGQPGHRYAIVQGDQLWYARSTDYAPYYLVENAGPSTVPREFATLADAVQAATPDWPAEILVSPGDLPSQGGITAPPGTRGHIVGAGREATHVLVAGGEYGISLPGAWGIEDLTLFRSGGGALLRVPGGTCGLTRVVLNNVQFRGEAAIIVNGGGTVTARESRFSNFGAFIGSGGTPGHVDVQACILTNLGGMTPPEVTASFRSCSMSGIGQIFVRAFAGRTTMTGSILWDRYGILDSSLLTARGCDIQNLGAYDLGPTNIDADPLFTSPDDLTLRPGSPCIDAGSPDFTIGARDFAGSPRVVGSRPDIGALEYQPPACPVDFNGDGFVDFFDYDDFVAAFEGGC